MDEQGNTSEREIINLLGKLRDAGPDYPPSLRADRRAAVLASLAVIPVATGLLAIPWIARLVKLIKGMAMLDKVILTVEVAAITGLTGYGAVTAYQYRYQLKELLFPAGLHTPFPTLSAPGASPGGNQDTALPGGVTGTPTAATGTAIPTISGPLPPNNTPVVQTPQPPPTQPPPTEPPTTHGTKLGHTKNPSTRGPKTPKP